MAKRQKIIIIFSLSVLFFVPFVSFCSAAELEINYPPLPGGIEINKDTLLPGYINYLYIIAIFLAGIIALLGLVVGGIQFMTSGGSGEKVTTAKQRMVGGILGLVILFSAHMILTKLNPDLLTLKTAELKPVAGLNLVGTNPQGETIMVPAPRNLSDVDRVIEKGFDKLKWVCTPAVSCDPVERCKQNPYPFFVYKYNEVGYKNFSDYTTMGCNGTTDQISLNSIKSYVTQRKRPGVYFYPLPDCKLKQGEDVLPPRLYTSSNRSFDPPYKSGGHINASVRIVNGPDPEKGPFYGVMLHTREDYLGGVLHIPACENLANCIPSQERCVSFSASFVAFGKDSLTIYNYSNGKSAGDGVEFWTDPKWEGGKKLLKDNWITECSYCKKTNIEAHVPAEWSPGTSEAELDLCDRDNPTFMKTKGVLKKQNECLGSIRLEGDYLLLLFKLTVEEAQKKQKVSTEEWWHQAQRFPISKELAKQAEYEKEGYPDYSIEEGPISLYKEWLKKPKSFLIIPLAEPL